MLYKVKEKISDLIYDYIIYPFDNFKTGLSNYRRWYKVIWQDRWWDHTWALLIWRTKLVQMREGFEKRSRYGDDNTIIRDLNICIKLIDRLSDNYYEMEYYDYMDNQIHFEEIPENPKYFSLRTTSEWEKFDDFLALYPNTTRLMRIKHKEEVKNDKEQLCRYVAQYNEDRGKRLLFKILHDKIEHWWN